MSLHHLKSIKKNIDQSFDMIKAMFLILQKLLILKKLLF